MKQGGGSVDIPLPQTEEYVLNASTSRVSFDSGSNINGCRVPVSNIGDGYSYKFGYNIDVVLKCNVEEVISGLTLYHHSSENITVDTLNEMNLNSLPDGDYRVCFSTVGYPTYDYEYLYFAPNNAVNATLGQIHIDNHEITIADGMFGRCILTSTSFSNELPLIPSFVQKI